MDERCFHCARAVPSGASFRAFAGGARSFCCAGCAGAARLIYEQGLERYYEFREDGARAMDDDERDWTVFDRDAAQHRYTHAREDGRRDASLQVDGIHCAACAWLIENSLQRLSGVCEIHVNPAGARAEIVYDPKRVTFGRVLARIHALGYLPRPLGFADDDDGARRERRTSLTRLAVAGFGMMQVMTFAVTLYAGAMHEGIESGIRGMLRFVSLLVTTPVVLYSAQPLFAGALRSLRARTLGMDVPVALSIGAAYAWSVWTTLRGHGEVYFDSVVMFVFFLLLGRYIEMSLRHRSASDRDAVARLLPESVLRIGAGGEERVTPDELAAGDRIRILPGERVPADGSIVSGATMVDESLLTGESAPRARSAGDTLIAGTLNGGGEVELRVDRVGQDSTLAAILRLRERAHAARPRLAEVADRIAAWFTGAVLLLAGATLLYWLQHDASRAFPAMLAVLVVTCPCALSLATPVALAAAMTRLARLGLLVARGRALETLARIDHVVFDKTGTLTRGLPRIDEVRLLSSRATRQRVLAVAAALERHSEHPIARAFADIDDAPAAGDIAIAVGRGVEGRLDGVLYRIGSSEYVRKLGSVLQAGARGVEGASVAAAGEAVDADGIATFSLPEDDARTAVILGDEAGVLAAFYLDDGLREDAREAVRALRRLGLDVRIASGDRPAVVARIAARLDGIPALAGASSADKLALVHSLQERGRTVAMVGDGVNDAPVLAGADVSVAIGSGADLAKVSADIIAMRAELAPLVAAVAIARRTRRIVCENLAWAAAYNAVAVPLAAAGMLAPWEAAIGMSCSSLIVVLNAMRLLRVPDAPRTRVTHASDIGSVTGEGARA